MNADTAMVDLYDALTRRIGERLTEAVTSDYPYTDAELRELLVDARKHTTAWIDRRVEACAS